MVISELQQDRDDTIGFSVGRPANGRYRGQQSPSREADPCPQPLPTRSRRRLLDQASTLLASSLDYETTLAQVADLVVPVLADRCIVHLVERDGSISRLATVQGDPVKAALARELERCYPHDPHTTEGVGEVVRTGRPLLVRDITDAGRLARAQDAEHLHLLRALDSHSAMIVPMVIRGQVLGAISLLSSRPDRHYAPADLHLAEDLAQRAAFAIHSARLYRDAQEALHARDEIFALLVHDLLQPVSTVKAGAKLLQTPDVSDNPETVAWLAHRVDSAAAKMSTMLGNLLDLARLESGQPLDLKLRPTDLVTLARQQVEIYEGATEVHRIRLETALSELVGQWDTQRVERAVSNLLSNAIKYSPDGGEILVRLTGEDDGTRRWAVLTIQDQGLGIPAADLPHIFERFRRGTNVVGRITGTGIGLASVKQVVEQHGGTVTVGSRQGTGTTFSLRLPLD